MRADRPPPPSRDPPSARDGSPWCESSRRGLALDNFFIGRLWRSDKWEEVYLQSYETVADAAQGLRRYFRFYNEERLHQALSYRTPASIYVASGG